MISSRPRAIAPAPDGVDLTPEEHARLIQVMNAGTMIGAHQEQTPAARTARNQLLTAYSPWIIKVSSKSSPSDQGRGDAAAEALVRATEALPLYSPELGVPLGAYLISNRVIVGEAISQAGRSLSLASLAQGRLASSRGTKAAYLAASLDEPRGFDGAPFGDALPADENQADPSAALSEASISAAVHAHLDRLAPLHRSLLVDRFGLGKLDGMTLEEMANDRAVNVSSISRGVARATAAFAIAAASLSSRHLITDED